MEENRVTSLLSNLNPSGENVLNLETQAFEAEMESKESIEPQIPASGCPQTSSAAAPPVPIGIDTSLPNLLHEMAASLQSDFPEEESDSDADSDSNDPFDMLASLEAATVTHSDGEQPNDDPEAPLDDPQPHLNETSPEDSNKSRKRKKKDEEKSESRKKRALNANQFRRNIQKIMDDNELESATRNAQQQEMERMQRLQEQQRLRYEVEKQRRLEEQAAELANLAALAEQELLDEVDSSPLLLSSPELSLIPDEVTILPIDAPRVQVKQEVRVESDSDDVIFLSSDEESGKPNLAQKLTQAEVRDEEDDDDDDDVVILSDDDSEVESEEESDVNNFGMHTRDSFNEPDSQGRVLVNVGHPPMEPDLFLSPQLARAVKPHQIGGIRFMFDNVVESLERYRVSEGFGCILAHSMGLGKTLQVISFCDMFLHHTSAHTVLCIVPINTLQNWMSEFNFWLPRHAHQSPLSKEGPMKTRNFTVFILNDAHKTITARAKVIFEWYKQGGVMLMGYELYRQLTSKKMAKKKGRKKKNEVVDLEEESKDKDILESIYHALVGPGPDLMVCDEGHRIKNAHASTSMALKNVRTKRRIVLTGYPLQNNLLEYWCMVDFVRPNFLGTKAEFCNMFERPILNGQCLDSTPQDVRLMRHRAHVLHSLVEGFVQRRSHVVLRSSLPPKEEHVLLLRMTTVQRSLYKRFMTELVQNKAVANPLRAFAICCKIWNHPDVLYQFLKKKVEDRDLDLDEVNGTESRKKGAAAVANPLGESFPGSSVSVVRDRREEVLPLDWAQELLRNYLPGAIENSAKFEVFFSILTESVALGDRLLVFSQSLFSLSLLEDYLQIRLVPNTNDRWTRNKHYFRLDGSTTAQEREKLVQDFNHGSMPLFLVSTRAGSLGINLVGANRVVVLDASWNPCHDAQAVCRVYRYGQQKQCFIYRLVMDNCLEKKIYDRQINKQGMADRVVDELNPEARLTLRDVTSLICDDEDDPPPYEYNDQADKFKDPVLKIVVEKFGDRFSRLPFQHESLLIDQKESKLSRAEKRLAKRSYEMEKQAAISGHGGTRGAYYPRNHSSNFTFPTPPVIQPGFYTRGRPPLKNDVTRQPGLFPSVTPEFLSRQGIIMRQVILHKDFLVPAPSKPGTPGGGTIRLPGGQPIMIIKTPKGIYLRLQDNRIIAVRLPGGIAPDGKTPANSMTTLLKLLKAGGMTMAPPSSQTSINGTGSKSESSNLGSATLRLKEAASQSLLKNRPTRTATDSLSSIDLSVCSKPSGIFDSLSPTSDTVLKSDDASSPGLASTSNTVSDWSALSHRRSSLNPQARALPSAKFPANPIQTSSKPCSDSGSVDPTSPDKVFRHGLAQLNVTDKVASESLYGKSSLAAQLEGFASANSNNNLTSNEACSGFVLPELGLDSQAEIENTALGLLGSAEGSAGQSATNWTSASQNWSPQMQTNYPVNCAWPAATTSYPSNGNNFPFYPPYPNQLPAHTLSSSAAPQKPAYWSNSTPWYPDAKANYGHLSSNYNLSSNSSPWEAGSSTSSPPSPQSQYPAGSSSYSNPFPFSAGSNSSNNSHFGTQQPYYPTYAYPSTTNHLNSNPNRYHAGTNPTPSHAFAAEHPPQSSFLYNSHAPKF